MENIHERQVEEILPYQFEPESGENTNDVSDESASERNSDISISDVEVDHEFEIANAWCLESLISCQCGHCS